MFLAINQFRELFVEMCSESAAEQVELGAEQACQGEYK